MSAEVVECEIVVDNKKGTGKDEGRGGGSEIGEGLHHVQVS